MTVSITYDEALGLLRQAVEEKGADYVYTKPTIAGGYSACVYFDPVTGEPSCIVGHVLDYLGLTIDDLQKDLNVSSAAALRRFEILDCDSRTAALLVFAQGNQDSGDPWGLAVDTAVTLADEHHSNYAIAV